MPLAVDFLHRDIPILKKRVHRLGLSFNSKLSADVVKKALDKGINYLFWTTSATKEHHEVVKERLRNDREKIVLAGGVSVGYFAGSVRRSAEKLLKSFDIEYLDVFQLYWLGKMSAFTKGVEKELEKLREEGLIRATGLSIHDRIRAGHLVGNSSLDMFMIRYNAAHPGAEKDIFPSYAKRRPLTVSYTATSWRRLLRKPAGWDGSMMTPGDCYRFVLSSPYIDVALTGATSDEQLLSNLEAIQKGPLSGEEEEWMRKFGHLVHG